MITIKNSSELQSNITWREDMLKLTKHCLEKYKETGQQFYLDYAKIFGEWSSKIKKNWIDTLI
jgi:ribosome biogenesis protein Tsr3